MVVSRIKQLNKDIRILVVANNDNPRNIILEYGADDFVIKPVGGETLLSKISMLIHAKLSSYIRKFSMSIIANQNLNLNMA